MPVHAFGSMRLHLAEDGAPVVLAVAPGDAPPPSKALGIPLFRVERPGRDPGGFGSMSPAYGTAHAGTAHATRDEAGALTLESRLDGGLGVATRLERLGDLPVVLASTTVTNHGERPEPLANASSLVLGGIAPECSPDWDRLGERFRVHHCVQTWEAEGQWKEHAPAELGLVVASTHADTNTFRIESRRSFTTNRFWPLLVLEDREANVAWFMEVEAAGAWALELGHASGWDGGIGSFFLAAHGPALRDFGWSIGLAPGASHTTAAVLAGCVAGGFDEAIAALTDARRLRRKARGTAHRGIPLFFNDYMNCLWGNPSRERLLPLIDAAASAGAEGFCIDAGWFCGPGESWVEGMGTYEPCPRRFGDDGLAAILALIKSRGMIPGLWLELEACNPRSPLVQKPDAWFLRAHGQRVIGADRLFFDFASAEVRAHFHAVIDRLVGIGAGFFKNDYNECHGPVLDGLGVEGVRAATEAFLSFIDEVRARHPRLLIENCGSGAMRSDNNTLSRFHIQSTSDQESAVLYSGIVEGALAQNPPETCGNWAYPWPMEFLAKDRDDFDADHAFLARMEDAEETILTLVNGLMGSLYLSGRIDRAPEDHLALVREATSLYKQTLRAHNAASVPFWPLGRKAFRHEGWRAVGLEDRARGVATIAVWRAGGDESECVLPARPCWKAIEDACILFPDDPRGASVSITRDGLRVRLPQAPTARLLQVAVRR